MAESHAKLVQVGDNISGCVKPLHRSLLMIVNEEVSSLGA
jgi:hypothetical protein